jgi:hypothetical protein
MSGLPRTVAEATDYGATSRHDDVLAFCREIAARTDLVRLTTMGDSAEGRDQAVVIVSDRGALTPEAARAQGKVIVLCQANIHAGEVEGKEAVQALLRDLTVGALADTVGREVLSRAVLVLVPDLNPDGNDRIRPENRRLDLPNLEGQENPPAGVGTRYSGEGWNLNRDYTKQEAVETRNLARLYQTWWPHVVIDCHTSDGSITAWDLTYDTSHGNQALFAEVQGLARTLLDGIARDVQAAHGYRAGWYGNYVRDGEPESGWHTYPALPRFGSHYRGLLGRLDVLLETYSYLSYRRRCEVMYAWLLGLFRTFAREGARVIDVVEREERRTIARGRDLDPRPSVGIDYGVARRDPEGKLVFDYPAHALDGDAIDVVAFERDALRAPHTYPGRELTTYRAPHHRWFVPTSAVSTPAAYVFDPREAPLVERLRGHGVEVEALTGEVELDVESYVVLRGEKTFSPDVAATPVPMGGVEVPLSQKPAPVRFESVFSVRPERRRARFAPGTCLVRTAQRAGTLAVYLLEPHSDDGFARWELLDETVTVGGLFPVHRVVAPMAVPTRKAE